MCKHFGYGSLDTTKRDSKRDISYAPVDPGKEILAFTASSLITHHSNMPYVNIKVTNESVTTEQKARLIKGVTQLLVDILGKNPQTTIVVIDEVETANWGIAGESVAVRRKRRE